jgi:DNA-binding beta-propeller fold protein YncE
LQAAELVGKLGLPVRSSTFLPRLLGEFGTSGSGNGQFKEPTAVAVDSNSNVFVADTGNNRVQKFNSNLNT